MSTLSPSPLAKLVISLFMGEKALIKDAASYLTKRFGEIDLVSPWYNFDFTDYYREEMGTGLSRRMMAFKELIDPGTLPEVKIHTCEIEQRLSHCGRRRVNIDPGYITAERFILATGKNFTHRVYLKDGVYADLTLIYTRKAFQPLPWTYPDYREPDLIAYLTRARQKYLADLKAHNKDNTQ